MSQFLPHNIDNNDETQFVLYNQMKLLEYSKLIRKEVIVKSMYQYQEEVNQDTYIIIKHTTLNNRNTLMMKIGWKYQDNEGRRPSLVFYYDCDCPTMMLSESQDTHWTEFIKIFNKNYVDIHRMRMRKFRMYINTLQLDYRMSVDGTWTIRPTPVLLPQDIRWINWDLRREDNGVLRFDKFTRKQCRSMRTNTGVRVFYHNKYLLVPNVTIRNNYDNIDGELLYQIQRGIDELINDTKDSIHSIYEKNVNNQLLTETINIEECVVCYDNTPFITNCNHYLCKDCCLGLVRPKICPICRRSLNEPKIQPIIQEQKEEPPIQEEGKDVEEEEGKVVEENPKYYNIEEQELFNNYILSENEISVNGSTYHLYYFKIDISDNQLTKLFPNLIRNPKIEMNCNLNRGYIEISVETN